jgi:predicted short-subunit dehydrogenase-like oxidoreductase (DUF2520 family)
MPPDSWKIAVVGAGRLAWSLIPALQRSGAQVLQLIARDAQARADFQQRYGIAQGAADPAALDPAVNLVFLAVSDSALPALAEACGRAASAGSICIHASGSAPLSSLAAFGGETGVCYPLQIFTREAVSDFRATPLFVELPGRAERLMPLMHQLSGQVRPMDSQARLRLHLGAVIACNFSNYLFRMAESQLPEDQSFEVYGPLLRRQVELALALGPAHTQTGPALRGDLPVLRAHLELLASHPEWQALYRRLSEAIRPGLGLD